MEGVGQSSDRRSAAIPTESIPPPISVVMPAYNCAPFVEEATRSILEQTWREFEFIIIDDGSTDGTQEILKRLAAEDSRIRLVCADHQGLVAALNLGIEISRGAFLARMDADDVCRHDRFEIQMAYLREHPEVVAVGANAEMIDPDGSPLGIVCPDFDPQELANKLFLGKGVKVWHSAILMRKETLQKVGGYRAAYRHAEDFDLWLRMTECGELHNLREVLLLYRQHPQSVCAQYRPEQRAAVKAAVADAHRRRGLATPQVVSSVAPKKAKPSAVVPDARPRWVRIALRHGRPATARKHLRSLLRDRPLALGTWLAVAQFAACPWHLFGNLPDDGAKDLASPSQATVFHLENRKAA